jgi:hypothetical protein
MKKLSLVILLISTFVSSASAHHMAQSDVAGVNIVEWSPHLSMEF